MKMKIAVAALRPRQVLAALTPKRRPQAPLPPARESEKDLLQRLREAGL